MHIFALGVVAFIALILTAGTNTPAASAEQLRITKETFPLLEGKYEGRWQRGRWHGEMAIVILSDRIRFSAMDSDAMFYDWNVPVEIQDSELVARTTFKDGTHRVDRFTATRSTDGRLTLHGKSELSQYPPRGSIEVSMVRSAGEPRDMVATNLVGEYAFDLFGKPVLRLAITSVGDGGAVEGTLTYAYKSSHRRSDFGSGDGSTATVDDGRLTVSAAWGSRYVLTATSTGLTGFIVVKGSESNPYPVVLHRTRTDVSQAEKPTPEQKTAPSPAPRGYSR